MQDVSQFVQFSITFIILLKAGHVALMWSGHFRLEMFYLILP